MKAQARYLSIAESYIEKIDGGHITIGDKLPSLRNLCKINSISMTTALRCYRHLEQVNYLVAEDKKGFYASAPHKLLSKIHFPTFAGQVVSLTTRAKSLASEQTLQSFSRAQPDPDLLDSDALSKCFRAVLRQPTLCFAYDHPQGHQDLRQALTNHFKQQSMCFQADDLVITQGCLDAVTLALETVTNTDDIVVVASPCYSGLLDLLALLNRKVLELPSTQEGLDLEILSQAIQKYPVKALLLSANHQNPTGHNLCSDQKKALLALAEQHQLPIIEDDVFREVSYHNAPPHPLKYFDSKGLVLWCSSVSKTLAPGLRVGWCHPGKFKQPYTKQRQTRSLGNNTITQVALANYINTGGYKRHLKKLNRHISEHLSIYVRALTEQLPEDTEIYAPMGGLVLWIRVPGLDADLLASKAAEQNILIKYGTQFSSTDNYRDCFRMNIGQIPTQKVLSQLTPLCELVYICKLNNQATPK